MEDINQYIQDTTSDYFVNNPTSNNNLLDTADDAIKHTKDFLQPHHYHNEPTTTPTIQFYSPTTQDHLTHDIMPETPTNNTATSTDSNTNVSSPKNLLPNYTKNPSNFIYTHLPDKPREELTSITSYTL